MNNKNETPELFRLYEKDIWNAAIEAAANKVKEFVGLEFVEDEIRKLKK